MHYKFTFGKFLRLSGFWLGGSLALNVLVAADTPAWITKSNADTQVLLDVMAKFIPEEASSDGLLGYDDKTIDLNEGIGERRRAADQAAKDILAQRLLSETDPEVQQDLAILIKAAGDGIETSLLHERLLLPFTDVGQLIFQGEFDLLADQVDAARRPSALNRLKRYTGLEPGSTPLTELAKSLFNTAAADPKRLGPFKDRVVQTLANSETYASGVRELYKKYHLEQLPGAAEALAAYEKQLADYSSWVKATVLPRAREDYRLPPEIYADNLKAVGLDIPPEELMHKALVAFGEIRNEMKALAPLIAKEHGLPDPDYRAVMLELKKAQIPKEEVESYYAGIIKQIEEIIRREHIVTLPERPMIMRLANAAENASQPAPHMQPPPLINNHGERGQFILTTGNPPKDKNAKAEVYDDFTHRSAAWTLTAHEGRPGHELQFSAMVERGVSLARSIYAENSVNVEGWALYQEAEMKPYEPLDGQFFALQHRLLRAARAFLDPMLNLGLVTRERAHDILAHDVGLSEPMTRQEVDRYTFRAPGQANAYFYGYSKLMELRTLSEVQLGAKFDRQAFNDFIIGQGLLPPALLAKAVQEEFIPQQLKK